MHKNRFDGLIRKRHDKTETIAWRWRRWWVWDGGGVCAGGAAIRPDPACDACRPGREMRLPDAPVLGSEPVAKGVYISGRSPAAAQRQGAGAGPHVAEEVLAAVTAVVKEAPRRHASGHTGGHRSSGGGHAGRCGA